MLHHKHVGQLHMPRKRVFGSLLVAIGLLGLLVQISTAQSLGMIFLLLLGLIFLTWGAVSGTTGLIIPGGILSGIGLGVFLTLGPLQSVSDPMRGGVFFLSFAAGWLLVTLVTDVFTHEAQRWPLIPAGVMALIGAALWTGGMYVDLLGNLGRFISQAWPVMLIGLGITMLFFNGKKR